MKIISKRGRAIKEAERPIYRITRLKTPCFYIPTRAEQVFDVIRKQLQFLRKGD